MYVCMCVCMSVCMYIRMYLSIMYVCTCVCVYIHDYACIYIYTHTRYTHTHTQTHTNTMHNHEHGPCRHIDGCLFFLNLFSMDRVARFRAGITTSLFHDLLDDAAVFVGSHVDLAGKKNRNSQTSVPCTIVYF
jgi:hypothetical protein